MIRAFFSAVVAALTLAWYDPLGTGKLTLFEVSYQWLSDTRGSKPVKTNGVPFLGR